MYRGDGYMQSIREDLCGDDLASDKDLGQLEHGISRVKKGNAVQRGWSLRGGTRIALRGLFQNGI